MAAGSIKELSIGRKDLFLLSPESITEEEGWNVRTDNDDLANHIRQLADSIKEIGVQQPLTVYMSGDKAVVTDGHCRLLAVRLAIAEGAEIKSIPVRTEERYSNEADRVLTMWTRNSGLQLTFHDQAKIVKRLLDFGWTELEISKKTGASRQHIGNMIKYLSAPVEIKQMIAAGEVSTTTAITQMRKTGEKAAENLKAGIVKAKSEGKKKATAKHLSKESVSQTDIKKKAKLFIDANVWDGEDRSGCSDDSASFTPDELQTLIDDLLDSLSI